MYVKYLLFILHLRLLQKNTENTIKNITLIKYHSSHIENKNDNKNNNPNTDNHSTLSPHSTVKGGIEIKIKPSMFKNNILGASLTSTKDNWLVNLTSITIPQDVQCLRGPPTLEGQKNRFFFA